MLEALSRSISSVPMTSPYDNEASTDDAALRLIRFVESQPEADREPEADWGEAGLDELRRAFDDETEDARWEEFVESQHDAHSGLLEADLEAGAADGSISRARLEELQTKLMQMAASGVAIRARRREAETSRAAGGEETSVPAASEPAADMQEMAQWIHRTHPPRPGPALRVHTRRLCFPRSHARAAAGMRSFAATRH